MAPPTKPPVPQRAPIFQPLFLLVPLLALLATFFPDRLQQAVDFVKGWFASLSPPATTPFDS